MAAKFTKISGFRAYTKLEQINLDNNSLTSFPMDEITNNLQYLYLSGNLFESVTVPEKLSNLLRLGVSFNPLTSLNINTSSIESLYMTGVPFSTYKIPSTLQNLIEIQIGGDNLTNVDFTDVNSSQLGVDFQGCSILETIDLKNKEAIYSILIQECPSLSSIVNGKLNRISIYFNTAITSYDFSNLFRTDSVSKQWSMYETTNVTSVNLGNLIFEQNSSVNNTALTTIIPATSFLPNNLGSNYSIAVTPLSTSTVNNILIACDGITGINPGWTKYIHLSGAAPTGAGITAKNSLIAKGWTVQTN